MKRTVALMALVVATCFSGRVQADAASVLAKHLGYTILESKTVEGFADKGKPRQDAFEGCDWDRVIIFTDGTAVRCRTYSYSYSYRPTAVILGKRVTFQGRALTTYRMVVGDESYDVEDL